MNPVEKNLNDLKSNIAAKLTTLSMTSPVQVVAVTKYASDDQIQNLLKTPHRLLGENKVQDAERKKSQFSDATISWHMIGHLQSNKVKKAIQIFDCIQSVHSEKLLRKIDSEAEKAGIKMDVFLQINLTGEPEKSGFTESELLNQHESFTQFQNITIAGLMVMGPNTKDREKIKKIFERGRYIYDIISKNNQNLNTLSMGMSHDYEIALETGSTMIRVGSLLMGGQ
ncbi:MAG: pyridoxal phosphate enzyme (YggS family) [Candidatus Marinamargulisbacteria bacterium]|jgi:pyridoxal phosphate enzyme (YggS family)